MRRTSIVIANFALAFSCALTGCWGSGDRNMRAEAESQPRENSAQQSEQRDYAALPDASGNQFGNQYGGQYDNQFGSQPGGQPSQRFNQASQHYDVAAVPYGQPQSSPYGMSGQSGDRRGGLPVSPLEDRPAIPSYTHNGYGDELSQYGAGQSFENSLERELQLLRESEMKQEQMLRQLHNNQIPSPNAIRDQEQKLQETRQKIHIYDVALKVGRGAGGGAGVPDASSFAAPGQPAGMDGMLDDMMNRGQIQAMAGPGGFAVPPRSEVRLPANAGPAARARPYETGAMDGMADEQERVVYDPRRDGDFNMFLLQAIADAPDAGGMPAAPEPERRTIVPAGAVAPGQRYDIPMPGAPKPFAGAPVGRAQFPAAKAGKAERAEPAREGRGDGRDGRDEWTPPSELFGKSAAPEEVLSRPGLFSADGGADEAEWPEFLSRPRQREQAPAKSQRPVVELNLPVDSPLQPPARRQRAAEPSQSGLRPESAPSGASVEEKPAAPAAREVYVAKPAAATPKAQEKARREPESVHLPTRAEPVDQVFVPDLFFSGR